ncbi:MAG: K(+)-transporting ATPase subunit C [Chlamydiae bacterium]|nr:K(+)-transporting ATPase subunit C [Chlamydiota bacterium]
MKFEYILKPFLIMLIMTILLGGGYPLITYSLGKLLFSHRSEGSLITTSENHTVVGSKLIGQEFVQSKYFHSRPSAIDYNAANSNSSNLGAINQKLIDQIKTRIENYKMENNIPDNTLLPIDAVCASGSGIDPHISLENAYMQAPRIAKARNLDIKDLISLIEKQSIEPFLGFMGMKRINVLLINLELDNLFIENSK